MLHSGEHFSNSGHLHCWEVDQVIRRATCDLERRTSDSFVEHIHRVSFSAIVETFYYFVVRSRALGTFVFILIFSDILSNVRVVSSHR